MPINAIHYRIKQLERAGLLRIDRLEKRSGRAIKHYKASASGFFVPFTASNSETFASFINQQLLPLHEHFYTLVTKASDQLIDDIQEVGYRMYDAGGYVNWDFTPRGQSFDLEKAFLHPDSPALLVAIENIRLSRESAKTLQQEVVTLLKKYSELGGEEDYAIYIGMSPGKLFE